MSNIKTIQVFQSCHHQLLLFRFLLDILLFSNFHQTAIYIITLAFINPFKHKIKYDKYNSK